MLADAIPALINLLAALLEFIFVSPPGIGGRTNGSSGGASCNHGQNSHRDPDKLDANDRNAALREARDFFGLDSKRASDRDDVKKTYKRLSLRHHPDRNGNSPESVEMMQKLNNHYDVLLTEIDRGKEDEYTFDSDGNDEENKESNRGEEEERWRVPRGKDVSDAKFRGKRGKKARRRRNASRRAAEEEARRRHANERAEMERQMRREWEEVEKRRREMKQKAKRTRRAAEKSRRREGLDTEAGRDRANRDWEDEVKAWEEEEEEVKVQERTAREGGQSASPPGSMHDIDNDDDVGEMTTRNRAQDVTGDSAPNAVGKKKKKQPKRPTNKLMESCTDDVVIALRLGVTEVVIDEIQSELQAVLLKEFELSVRTVRRPPDEDDIHAAMRKYLLFSLDSDDNTVLHYATYYGSSDVVDYVAHLSRRCGAFVDVFLAKNHHGHIPLDCGAGRWSEEDRQPGGVRDRMASLTEYARKESESEKFGPKLGRAASRMCGVVRSFNVVATINAVASYWVGRNLFKCGRIVSVALAAWVQKGRRSAEAEGMIGRDGQSEAFLFALYAMWSMLRSASASLWDAFEWDDLVPYVLILIPPSIMYCCAEKSTNTPTLLGIISFPPWTILFALRLLSDLLARLSGSIAVPGIVHKRQLEQSFFLCFFSTLVFGIRFGCRVAFRTD